MLKAYELEKKIKNWVKNNYGESELDNPSWDIDGLVEELCQEIEAPIIGTISVDSGTIMVEDPCYWIDTENKMSWSDFCSEFGNNKIHNFNHSKLVSGKGTAISVDDGVYYVRYDGDHLIIDLK